MTDMPETIWVTGGPQTGSWNDNETNIGAMIGETAYRRADLLPKVKALVWEARDNGFWRAVDPTGGCYEVMRLSEGRAACHHLVAGHGRNIGNGHQSPQEAQAAAQADYTARILAALVTP